MKSAVVIGASSGIGRALAIALSLEGYRLGVVARRTDLLTSLRAELAGVRYRLMKLKLPIVVTDIQPGFVDTRMAGGDFWMTSPETAARQIVAAIRKRRPHVYVTRRWRLVAWLMRVVGG